MKLVEDWRRAWRWYSMWAFSAISIISGGSGILVHLTPTMLGAKVLFMPTWTWAEVVASVIAFLAITGGIGRLISQKPEVDIEVGT